MKLKGKVAIITGAGFGRGMSRGFPQGFAREGADLSLNIRRNEPEKIRELVEELESYGVRVCVTVGDISEEAVVRELVENTLKTFGRVDILLNNAGITNPKPITEMTVEDWDRMMAVNLRSHFLACKYVIPHMIAQRSGRIINVSSQIAQKGGTDHCHYAAAKAGIIGMTKALAWDLGKYGITCNCIAPGPIDTQMICSGLTSGVVTKANLGLFAYMQSILLTLNCGEENCSVYCRAPSFQRQDFLKTG